MINRTITGNREGGKASSGWCTSFKVPWAFSPDGAPGAESVGAREFRSLRGLALILDRQALPLPKANVKNSTNARTLGAN